MRRMNCAHFLFNVAGLLVAYAYDDISYNKVATQSHSYTGNGYDASNAVDGDLNMCMRTIEIGKIAPKRTVWWKVDLGAVYSIYRITILFKNYEGFVERQRGRFAGFSLYVSKSDVISSAAIKNSFLCYKNGYLLPPLNFTTVCTEVGRYVIYYNERLNGVTYPAGYEVTNVQTELCEVIVQGCANASFYGQNCDTSCPTKCKNNTCHIQSGACSLCKPGWTGQYCDTKCAEGWYDFNCSQRCTGHCRDRATCNYVTGRCDGGCDAGWTGYMCNKECDDGTYAYNCINNCSGHCINGSPCNKQTGHCQRGCNPGYTTGDCSKECLKGYFGLNCTERCSGQCANSEPCDHISGVCHSGCQDGYIGNNCNNSCMEGYFGENCSRQCSPNCKSDTCRHTDGWCTCAAGSMADNCTTGSTEHQVMNQNTPTAIIMAIGLSVSILINIILIACRISLCRKDNSNISISLLSCWKRSIYQDSVDKREEASVYHELDLSENAYQNTSIRC